MSIRFSSSGLYRVPNAKGKLTKVTNGFSITEYLSFDTVGKVTRSKQTTDGVVYGTDESPMTFVYNLSGVLIEQKYPSGRVVKNVIDHDGDLSIIQSKKSANYGYWNYANNFTYTATGAVSSMQLGNGKWESTQFNSRLQPTQIALGLTQNATNLLKLDYNYGSTSNNGNIQSQTIAVPMVGGNAGFVATQSYAYDSLNRLTQATETIPNQTGWQQAFIYDQYGNRNFNEAITTTLPKNCGTPAIPTVCLADVPINNPSVNVANNRLNGYQFDNAGNTTRDAQSRKFAYDGENKQIKVETVDQNGVVTGTVGEYWYDGDGKRVKKISYQNNVPTETTIFVYDASAKLVAEYSTVVASENEAKIGYLTPDHLGSSRINTDRDGRVTARHDYHPFGEEIVGTGGRTADLGYGEDDVRKKFTGYERDDETGIDFGQARYYSSKLGRFYSVDPENAGAVRDNPQTWNAFAYVGNNPITVTDPTGLSWYYSEKMNWVRWIPDGKEVPEGFAPVVGNNGEAGSFSYQAEDGTWVTLDPYSNNYQTNIATKEDSIKLASRLYQLDERKRAFIAGYNKNYDTHMFLVTMMAVGDIAIIAAPVIGLSGAGTTALGLTRVAATAPTGVAALTQLLNSVPRWEQLTSKMQGVVQGNAAQTFQQITQGATKMGENVYKLSDGRVVTLYPSSTNQVMTIQVQSGIKIVVRFTQ